MSSRWMMAMAVVVSPSPDMSAACTVRLYTPTVCGERGDRAEPLQPQGAQRPPTCCPHTLCPHLGLLMDRTLVSPCV